MNPICCECCREMKCKKNGVLIEINQHHFYSGDKFHCDECNRSIITGIGQPFTVAPFALDSKEEVIKLVQ